MDFIVIMNFIGGACLVAGAPPARRARAPLPLDVGPPPDAVERNLGIAVDSGAD